MKNMRGLICLGLLICTVGAVDSQAQDTQPAESVAADSATEEVVSIRTITASGRFVDTTITVKKLDFDGVLIREALTALARTYHVSLLVDTSVTGHLTMRLENVSLDDAFRLIVFENHLTAQRLGSILKIFKEPTPPAPPRRAIIVLGENTVSIVAERVPLRVFAEDFTDSTRINVTLQQGVTGHLTGKVVDLAPRTALLTLLESNGYAVRENNGVYVIEQPGADQTASPRGRRFTIVLEEGRYSVDLDNADLSSAVATLFDLAGADVIRRSEISGKISASFSAPSLDNALSTLLFGSDLSYKKVGAMYVIGEASSADLHDTRLIQVKNLSAETVEKLLPASLMQGVTHKLYVEQNGIVVTGPSSKLDNIEEFVRRTDKPTAQVLFDVLVVDYRRDDFFNWNLTATKSGVDSIGSYYPSIDFGFAGNLQSLGDRLGISGVGKLTDRFFVRLQALAREGKAKIIQRPQIAALNGQPASIKIGTTQYFLLETSTIYPSTQSNISTQTSERFQTIEANISLEVTPQVTSLGEVIVKIKPEFNTPVGTFDPDIPPTIDKRVLESTVKVKDGETIILGGLVTSTETESISKFPFLGDIPLLGKLFQNRTKTTNKSELMIYITPHVYYGSEGSIEIEEVMRQ